MLLFKDQKLVLFFFQTQPGIIWQICFFFFLISIIITTFLWTAIHSSDNSGVQIALSNFLDHFADNMCLGRFIFPSILLSI